MNNKLIEGSTTIEQLKALIPFAYAQKSIGDDEFVFLATKKGKELDSSFGKHDVLLLIGLELSGARNCSVSSLFDDLALNDDDVKAMADSVFIVPNLIVLGHLHAFIAPANGGKTALMIHQSAKLAEQGYEVIYINVDASPGDLKRHYGHAKKHGYKVIAPDAKQGKSVDDAISWFEKAANEGLDLSKVIIILDTLKKFTEVIQKSQSKEFYKLMRKMTVQGATIIMLGHSNKYPGADGKQIYEGTADLRNDVDDLIYLNSVKNEETNRLEITTFPDKIRADFEPRSFYINLDDRSVEEPEEVVQILDKERQHVLRYAKEAIGQGLVNQSDIVSYVQPLVGGVGKARLIKYLTEFTLGIDPKLSCTRGNKNAAIYSIPKTPDEAVKEMLADWGNEEAYL